MRGGDVPAAHIPFMTDILQLNADRHDNGQFGEHEHTEPEATLAEELDDDVDDDDSEGDILIEFEHDGHDYDVSDEGDGSFSIYRASDAGRFITNFSWAGDIEDHDELEEAAVRALSQ